MDFAELDLKTASERGSWVHLQYEDELLFLDSDAKSPKKPCRVKVRGIGSQSVMDAFKKVERLQTLQSQKLTRTKPAAMDQVLAGFQEQIEQAGAELILAAVCEWENIHWGGKELPFEEENVLKICGPGTLFIKQVQDAISESERLFTKPDSA